MKSTIKLFLVLLLIASPFIRANDFEEDFQDEAESPLGEIDNEAALADQEAEESSFRDSIYNLDDEELNDSFSAADKRTAEYSSGDEDEYASSYTSPNNSPNISDDPLYLDDEESERNAHSNNRAGGRESSLLDDEEEQDNLYNAPYNEEDDLGDY